MEFLLLAALGLAAYLIKRFGHRETDEGVDRRDQSGSPRPQPAPRPARAEPAPSAHPQPAAASAPAPAPASARKWTDCTPTPLGARQDLSPRARRAADLAERARQDGGLTLKGRAWVVDGDTIVIDKTHIRLAGIDAPELDHPYGQSSKWAMVKMCKGREVTAEIKPEMSHDRVVAVCRLEDGTDLAEALVKRGLALDWRTYSGGRYRRCEPHDARKKLWKTAMRQGRAGR